MTKKIQYCTCKVNLAGQNCHTVIYNDPVTWPEIQVLMQLHGEENVMDIMPCGIGDVWPTDEKNRLTGIYGPKVVEACFPGRAFRMDFVMTGEEDLPRYADGTKVSTKEPKPGNGDDDEDDGEDEVAKNLAAASLEPIFKPRGRKAEVAKEA
jgi:hypothetical protein